MARSSKLFYANAATAVTLVALAVCGRDGGRVVASSSSPCPIVICSPVVTTEVAPSVTGNSGPLACHLVAPVAARRPLPAPDRISGGPIAVPEAMRGAGLPAPAAEARTRAIATVAREAPVVAEAPAEAETNEALVAAPSLTGTDDVGVGDTALAATEKPLSTEVDERIPADPSPAGTDDVELADTALAAAENPLSTEVDELVPADPTPAETDDVGMNDAVALATPSETTEDETPSEDEDQDEAADAPLPAGLSAPIAIAPCTTEPDAPAPTARLLAAMSPSPGSPGEARAMASTAVVEAATAPRETIPSVPVEDPEESGERPFDLAGSRAELAASLGAATSAYRRGSYTRAIETLLPALRPWSSHHGPWGRRAPELAQAYVVLGKAYRKKDEFAPAAEFFKKAIEEDPKDASVWNTYAWTQVIRPDRTMADLIEATNASRRAVELSRGRVANYLDTLAKVHFLNGDVRQALETQRKVVARVPSRDSFRRRLRQYEREVQRLERLDVH